MLHQIFFGIIINIYNAKNQVFSKKLIPHEILVKIQIET